MKYLKKFNESFDNDLSTGTIINILQNEYNYKFQSVPDRISSQFWIYRYLSRSIGIKTTAIKPNVFSKLKRYVVVHFLDMDIKNVSDIYKKSKFGKDDGIYILLNSGNEEDIAYEVNIAIEQLKDYIDLE